MVTLLVQEVKKEELGRARSSLERANLEDGRYFMTIDPFVHKSPFDRSLIPLLVYEFMKN